MGVHQNPKSFKQSSLVTWRSAFSSSLSSINAFSAGKCRNQHFHVSPHLVFMTLFFTNFVFCVRLATTIIANIYSHLYSFTPYNDCWQVLFLPHFTDEKTKAHLACPGTDPHHRVPDPTLTPALLPTLASNPNLLCERGLVS